MANLRNTVEVIRRKTGLPVDTLASALKATRPIAVTQEWTACRSEERRAVLTFLDELSKAGATVEVVLGDETVSREFLENQVALRGSIEEETRMMMDLESGAPSEEALQWQRDRLREGGG